jgi:hypothetical protein
VLQSLCVRVSCETCETESLQSVSRAGRRRKAGTRATSPEFSHSVAAQDEVRAVIPVGRLDYTKDGAPADHVGSVITLQRAAAVRVTKARKVALVVAVEPP